MNSNTTFNPSDVTSFEEVDDLKFPTLAIGLSQTETSAESPVYSRKEKSLG